MTLPSGIDMGYDFDFVDESRHSSWTDFVSQKIGNLQEHKIREYLECILHYSEVDNEQSEEILKVECLEFASPAWARSVLSHDQVDQGKSMCLR